MYINKISIKNIRSIKKFEMTFEKGKEAGWHVLIGNNGAGKSTILRSIALCLIGPEFAPSVNRKSWDSWLPEKIGKGTIQSKIRNENYLNHDINIPVECEFERNPNYTSLTFNQDLFQKYRETSNDLWFGGLGWFSAGFGPFRRFSGGSGEWESYYDSTSFRRVSSHLSLFNESVAFPQIIEWLKYVKHKSLETKETRFLNAVTEVINSPNFLPDGVKLHEINADGVFFKDGNGYVISIDQLSDGFRSILSLAFELLRILYNSFDGDSIVQTNSEGTFVNVPGVVMIDEVDAHLHPSWQTEIGQWFTKHFPKIQFIVTTHNPIICRGCINSKDGSINGTIWRLARPGYEEQSGKLDEQESNRLIFGNVLDAYGTGAFGNDVTITKFAGNMLREFAKLNRLKLFGQIAPEQEQRRLQLEKIFVSDATDETA